VVVLTLAPGKLSLPGAYETDVPDVPALRFASAGMTTSALYFGRDDETAPDFPVGKKAPVFPPGPSAFQT